MFEKEQSVRSFASLVVKVFSDKMSQSQRRLRQRGGGSGAGGSNEGQAAAAAEADEEDDAIDELEELGVGDGLDETEVAALEAPKKAAPAKQVCVTVAFALWRHRTAFFASLRNIFLR